MASIPGKRWWTRDAVFGVLACLLCVHGCSSKGCTCSWFSSGEKHAERVYTDVEMLAEGGEPKVTLRVARWAGLRYRLKLASSGMIGIEGAPPVSGPTTTMVLESEVLHGSSDPIVQRQDGGIVQL